MLTPRSEEVLPSCDALLVHPAVLFSIAGSRKFHVALRAPRSRTTEVVIVDSVHPSSARLVTRLLAGTRPKAGAAGGPLDNVAAAFDRTSHELSRWLGSGGCHELLARALKQVAVRHPALSRITLTAGSHPHLNGLAESLEASGPVATSAGLEAALVALFELLGRLIGEDLSTRLAELAMTNGAPDGAHPHDTEPLQ